MPAPAGVLVDCVGPVVFGDLGVVVPLDELDAHAVHARDVLPTLAVGAVVDVLVLAVPTVPAVSVVLVALRMHVHVFVEPNLVGALSPVRTCTHRLVIRSGRVVHDSVDLGCNVEPPLPPFPQCQWTFHTMTAVANLAITVHKKTGTQDKTRPRTQ